jgi:hypothetical protein
MLGCSAAAPSGPAELAERDDAIVYGDDDRRDLYEAPSDLRELGRNAIVGLVPKARLQRAPTGEVRLSVVALGVAYDLCEDERFREQPTAADCTGVLIDDDLVLTAGHCFEDLDCSDYNFVFDYFYRAPGQLEPIGAGDVYSCRKLVAREMSARNGREIDYAVAQLDRPARERRPLALRTQLAPAGEPLLVLGMGSGLPLKIDDGARVVEPRATLRDYFMLEADTFEGSSGSAVLDASGALLGILVRGGTDYVPGPTGRCKQVNWLERAVVADLPGGELAHEEATYALNARDGLCQSGFPSRRLCDIEPSCGDTFCSADESRASCPEDCDPCAGVDCGARGSVRATALNVVKQGSGEGRAAHDGCALGPSGSISGAGLVSALAALLGIRRRRRAFSRPDL